MNDMIFLRWIRRQAMKLHLTLSWNACWLDSDSIRDIETNGFPRYSEWLWNWHHVCVCSRSTTTSERENAFPSNINNRWVMPRCQQVKTQSRESRAGWNCFTLMQFLHVVHKLYLTTAEKDSSTCQKCLQHVSSRWAMKCWSRCLATSMVVPFARHSLDWIDVSMDSFASLRCTSNSTAI